MTAQLGPVPVEERLRAIQSITDAALARLDDRDLLAELLERTRDALQADTAAVLLLDYSSGQLIATAAAGLEEEVHQGVRIPVGRGFAGRIAAEHRPVILDHVDHTTVLNPILWAKGIQSMMGVPMVAGGRVIGVLHVGSLTRRRFTGHDTELLQLAADRAAAAVQSMTAQADRLAAVALQRSLVPAALPAVRGGGAGGPVHSGQRRGRRGLVRRVQPAVGGAVRGDRRCGRVGPARRGDHGPDAQRAARLRAGDPGSG